jgi:hypothetical protein
MRRFLSLLFALVTLAGLAADPPAPGQDGQAPGKEDKAKAKGGKGPLAEGNNLPGPFHPFNVTGPRKGNFHCLVSEYDLEPVVMIVARDLELSEPFKDLLKRLDNAIAKNPAVRLRGFVVLLSDALPDVVQNDDKREELAAKLEDAAKGLELKHVVLCLDSKSDLEKYALDESAAATVVLYHKLKVVAHWPLSRQDLTAAKVQEIMTQVADKLGARRK